MDQLEEESTKQHQEFQCDINRLQMTIDKLKNINPYFFSHHLLEFDEVLLENMFIKVHVQFYSTTNPIFWHLVQDIVQKDICEISHKIM
jgi:hypothetical protein